MLVIYELKTDKQNFFVRANLIYEDAENIYLSSENTVTKIAKNNLEEIKILGK